jgi:hypothetical protein
MPGVQRRIRSQLGRFCDRFFAAGDQFQQRMAANQGQVYYRIGAGQNSGAS